MIKNTLMLFTLIFLNSCVKTSVYQEYKDIPQLGWHTDSLLVFDFNLKDTTLQHNVVLAIRHNINYDYQNLFLFISSEEKRDTVEILLSDKKGKWYGKGVGNIRETKTVLKEIKIKNTLSPQKIFLEQAMRYGPNNEIKYLKNIKSIGLIVRTKNE